MHNVHFNINSWTVEFDLIKILAYIENNKMSVTNPMNNMLIKKIILYL